MNRNAEAIEREDCELANEANGEESDKATDAEHRSKHAAAKHAGGTNAAEKLRDADGLNRVSASGPKHLERRLAATERKADGSRSGEERVPKSGRETWHGAIVFRHIAPASGRRAGAFALPGGEGRGGARFTNS